MKKFLAIAVIAVALTSCNDEKKADDTVTKDTSTVVTTQPNDTSTVVKTTTVETDTMNQVKPDTTKKN